VVSAISISVTLLKVICRQLGFACRCTSTIPATTLPAEQIVIPADLADILKAYTKEVIRRQPDNLVEFSAK